MPKLIVTQIKTCSFLHLENLKNFSHCRRATIPASGFPSGQYRYRLQWELHLPYQQQTKQDEIIVIKFDKKRKNVLTISVIWQEQKQKSPL